MNIFKNEFHWGNLTLIDHYPTPSYLTTGKGEKYVADTHGGPYMWRLRCDCGYEWELPRENFPGRRALRSCGQPECTVATNRPKTGREIHAAIGISIPVALIEQVKAYAAQTKVNTSRAAAELLYKGLAAALIEDE